MFTDITCDDNNPCTFKGCEPSTGCFYPPKPQGSPCPNNDKCDGDETCNGAGHCDDGTPPVCVDNNPCTIDDCDATQGCTYNPQPNTYLCVDGNVCNGTETCDGAGTCQAGTPINYADTNPCTIDTCDAITGPKHENAAVGTSCDDLIQSNGEELCDQNAVCQHLPLSITAATDEDVSERRFGNGRHPVAASPKGVAVAFQESLISGTNVNRIGVAVFSPAGEPAGVARISGALFNAAPVVAPLPDGSYALAYTAQGVDSDGLGVAIVRVSATGTLIGTPKAANSTAAFGQMNPDLIWTGTEVVAAWEDESVANVRRICTRRFNAQLTPLGAESCENATGIDSRVALGVLDGAWVAAWRRDITADPTTTSTLVVRVGNHVLEASLTGGSFDEHPAIAALDSDHFLIAYTDGALKAVVVNSAGEQEAGIVLGSERGQPALASITGGVVLGWRGPAVLGDGGWTANLDELMIQRLLWDGAEIDTSTHSAFPVPTTSTLQAGDQQSAALAPLAFTSQEAMVVGWEDWAPNVNGHASHGDVLFSIEVIPFAREAQ